jgi:kumamolisin
MPGGGIELANSFRSRPTEAVNQPDDDSRIAVTLHLKHPDEPQHPPGSAAAFAALGTPISRRGLARERATQFKPARAVLAAFAQRHKMKLGAVRPMRRTARLTGTVAQIREAFGATLHRSADGKMIWRSGALHLAGDIAPWTRAVLGFGPGHKRAIPAMSGGGNGSGLWPREIGTLYGVPAVATATGQCIGIIAQGGTYQLSDLRSAANESGGFMPIVTPPPQPSVFGMNPNYDQELALDLQVLAGLAPGAKLSIYFVPDNIENTVDGLHAALADTVNAPHVVSLSWSSSEDVWDADTRGVFDAALADAYRLRVAVVVAAGDFLATGGFFDGAHVFYPASSPYVLGCGGTSLVLGPGPAIVNEEVWNDGFGTGTGGGISRHYPVPSFQTGLALPDSVNPGAPAGRGVPDVAAAASSDPGYAVFVNGARNAFPGTSAAAPLWAGLLALANARRGSPLGFANRALYANSASFKEILTGDNKVQGVGYVASAGWNACCGLGAPKADQIIAALAAATPG